MKNVTISILVLLFSVNFYAQIENLTTKFDLPNALEESSGLLFYNNRLITHNDSGDNANLYELDTISGQIVRTIHISNAQNNDWEDIAEDDDFIYVGDFGNNNGNRTDLKVYRVNKVDYLNNTTVTAETISFSYEDQTDFSDNSFTNFDAEAMVIYNDNILIFTKNRGDFKTNAYVFPKTIGTHIATRIDSYNTEGLITGATINNQNLSIFLTGYTFTLQPFLIYLDNFTGDELFNGTIIKTPISNDIGVGSQLEAITHINNNRYFLSREERSGLIQRVFVFDSLYTLNLNNYEQNEINVYPNPFNNNIQINTTKIIEKIIIVDLNGKAYNCQNTIFSNVNISNLETGTYFLKIYFKNEKPITKTIIKH